MPVVLRADCRATSAAAQVVAEFSDFYRGFMPTLVAFLVWQGAALADAAEIAQDTMTALYRSWRRVDQPAAWARVVASRTYARWLASVMEDPVESVPEVRSPPLRDDTDLHQFAERHEVLHLLELLPARQRQVMAWTYDGHSPAEIAEQLSMTPAAVRASLLKARRTLIRHLAAIEEKVQSR